MQSYNHPAWQYPRPHHHAASLDVPPPQFTSSPRPRYTTMSGPSSPNIPPASINLAQTFIPPSLTAGPQHARIWDNSSARRPRTSHGPMTPPSLVPRRPSLYGDYLLSRPQTPLSPPPLPQKPQALLIPLTNSLPPIPPKPPALTIAPASRIPLYPASIPLPVVGSRPPPPEFVAFGTMPTPNEKDFELALTLSATEARKRERDLIAQEEEELARALEESRLLSDSVYTIDGQSSTSFEPPSVDRALISAIKAPTHPPDGESWLHLVTPTTPTSSCLNEDLPSPHSPVNQDVSDADPSDSSQGTNDVETPHTARDVSQTPPLYTNVVSNLVRNSPPALSPNVAPASPSTTSFSCLQSDHISDLVPTSPSLSLTLTSSSEQLPIPPFTPRPSWSSASSENSMSVGHSLGGDLVPVSGYKSPMHFPASPDRSPAPLANLDPLDERPEEADTEQGPSSRPTVPLSANQYVEREMLMGVSMGFSFPVISTEVQPMPSMMPNVITLPYGKAPVFHFQAPSWRKLLKLMARLSATRVEPTIDAISVARHDLKLRTVIQFVKIHHSASEWRTLLYLTTDYPTPSNLHSSHKYTNGDVSVLPYSYTLSPLPTLLRDGPESSMAKYYVVPSTSTTPYPNLPINFPNLAMYLQSAVQDSRRASNDSSSGMRKLAQFIDGCYQMESDRVAAIDQEAVSKKGVGRMIKRVIGRHRASKNSRGNDEIYELVTPFVSDEWG